MYGSTLDKKVEVHCEFTAFGEPHQFAWEGSLDETFESINTILSGKIWDLLKNRVEIQNEVLIYHFNSEEVFERKQVL